MSQLRLPHSFRDHAMPLLRPPLRYVRELKPLHFPEEAEVPESKTHLTLRTFLYQLLQFALGPEHSVGSDQFVYWNASNPRCCLAPDVFVKLHVPDRQFGSWKAWERGGPPDLAVEMVSPNERDGIDWDEKLRRYYECGVNEVVRFDPAAAFGLRIRVWDRVDDDLIERAIIEDATPCVTLASTWVVCPVDNEPMGLRLVDDAGHLLESRIEHEAKAREAETKAREAAEARVRELEAELARRSSQ